MARDREIILRQNDKLSNEYLRKAKRAKTLPKTVENLIKAIIVSRKNQAQAMRAGYENLKELDLTDSEIQKALKVGVVIGTCLTVSETLIQHIREDLKARGVY